MWQIIPVRDSDGQPCIGILAHALKVIHTLPPEQGALADALCLRRNRLAQPRLMSVDRWRSDVLPLEQRLAQLLALSAEVERQIADAEARLAAAARECPSDALQGP